MFFSTVSIISLAPTDKLDIDLWSVDKSKEMKSVQF